MSLEITGLNDDTYEEVAEKTEYPPSAFLVEWHRLIQETAAAKRIALTEIV